MFGLPSPTTLLLGALGVAVAAAAVGGAYLYGESEGDAAGFERGTNRQQLVIDKLKIEHDRALIEANDAIDAESHRLQQVKDEHEVIQARQKEENVRISRELTRT